MFVTKNDPETGLMFLLDENSEFYTVVGFYDKPRKAANIPPYFDSLPVTNISATAFENYIQLYEIYIPETVTYINKYFCFNCKSLNKIEVHPENPVFYSSGNCLIDKEEKKILLLCQNSIIPKDENIVIIADNAFLNCTDYDKIVIPPYIIREQDIGKFIKICENMFLED